MRVDEPWVCTRFTYPRSPAMDFLLSYFVVLFVGSASFIVAFATIQRRRYPPK